MFKDVHQFIEIFFHCPLPPCIWVKEKGNVCQFKLHVHPSTSVGIGYILKNNMFLHLNSSYTHLHHLGTRGGRGGYVYWRKKCRKSSFNIGRKASLAHTFVKKKIFSCLTSKISHLAFSIIPLGYWVMKLEGDRKECWILRRFLLHPTPPFRTNKDGF